MSKKKWEVMLHEARTLATNGRENLFEIVSRLVAVYEDQRFREHHGDKIDEMEEHLSQVLVDYDLSYGEASLMLHYYPVREQWRSTPVRQMLAESIVRRDAETKKDAPVRQAPRRVTLKEYEALQEQVKEEHQKVEQLTDSFSREVSSKDKRIAELEEENRILRRDLARAEGRISELERLVKREPVAA